MRSKLENDFSKARSSDSAIDGQKNLPEDDTKTDAKAFGRTHIEL